MTVTRLFLVRHGQVEGYQDKRYNGQGDVSLTPLGERQARAVCDRLRDEPLSAVYSSDLARCRFGAGLIAAEHDLPLCESADLRELDIGTWQGATWQELQRMYPEAWAARLRDIVHFKVPGGESVQQAADRVRPRLQAALREHAGGTVVLVGHGGVNRIILLDAIGAPLERLFAIEQDYGCYNIIDYAADGGSQVRLMNCRPRLPQVGDSITAVQNI